jgi:CheY-like chemotaxis protein
MLDARTILLVEDDQVDLIAVKRVLKDAHVTQDLACAQNGEEALDYLRGKNRALPCLILLDLNMPRMGGLEFLEVLRADAALQGIPVVVVTTSTDNQDMAKCAALGIAAYVLKCPSFAEFRKSMEIIQPYLSPAPVPEQRLAAVR